VSNVKRLTEEKYKQEKNYNGELQPFTNINYYTIYKYELPKYKKLLNIV